MSEGWHSFLKALAAVSGKVKSRRLDWLLWVLNSKVVPYYMAQVGARLLGANLTRRAPHVQPCLSCALEAQHTCIRTLLVGIDD